MIDISALRERPAKDAYTVTELNNFIKGLLDSDRTLSAITVTGEISNLTDHRSGHIYFSLKDSDSQIKAVMFRSQRATLKFQPKDGMMVTVRGSISLYSAGGSLQLYANKIEPDGVGSLYMAYEQLKEKLLKEGLFDESHKSQIPRSPSKIGIITSPTGAAVRDIINVTGRRYPIAQLYIYPSLVQGDGAEDNLISAIDYFDKTKLVDVIIIGRGGGSIEDLWAFNSEKLAKRIYACGIPVISAVGHETDFTICDFVSDMRAPTPSAAAEIAVPDIRDLSLYLDDSYTRIENALLRTIERRREKLDFISDSLIFRNPEQLFGKHLTALSDFSQKITFEIHKNLTRCKSNLQVLSAKANTLSPLAVLSRGYSVTEHKNKIVNGVGDISVGDLLKITFSDGTANASVESITPLDDERKQK